MADSGGGPAAWQEVDSQASDFIDMIDEPALLESTKFRWESIKEDETLPMGKTLGSYLFLARGRARLTLTRMGVTTEPDILLTQAAEDLNQALEYEPDNVHIYWYLAQSALARGEMLVSRGNLDARNIAYQEARSYLQQAIDRLPEDVQSHINLSRIKFQQLSFNLPSGMTPDQFKKREEIVSYSADLFSISEKFRDDPKINFELSKFYQMFPEELDNAIEVADKAMTVDSENVSYALWSSNLHYRKFSVYHDKSEMDKALEIARQALELPGAQETTGPRNFINKNNRLALYFFLAGCYVEQLLEPVEQVSESERQEKLKNAEDAVHQIEQIFGSGEDPQVILWQGMLELAKGDSESAVRKLYSAYTQLKISGIEGTSGTYLRGPYSLLSYTLANYYKETPEKGAVFRFLVSAWQTGITINKPYVYLDIAEQVFELGDFQTTNLWVDRYETEHGIDVRSKKLRIRSYINTNRFEDAEKEMTSATELNELELTQLRLSLLQAKILQLQIVLDRKRIQETMRNSGIIQEEISEDASLLLTSGEDSGEIAADDSNEFISEEMKTYRQEYSDLIKEYVMSSPESLNEAMLLFACNNYLTLNDIESAQALVNIFLTYTPENLMALFYKEYLQEPEPSNISEQKRFEIRKNVLSNLSNQAEGWINLAGLHVTHNEYDKATEYFNKVVQVDAWENEQGLFERPVFEGVEPTYSQIQIAAGQLFGLSIDRQDWELARKIANIARVENLDECEGQYFYARLAFAENNYQEALSYIENALSLRPVFSHGYILRSSIHSELGSHTASIEDAREASNINPQNPDHAKRLALVLYQRNQRLGDTVTREQTAEARVAFDRALNLNSSDRQLLSFYAEYISSTNPDHALAIRQYLYQSESNMENALLLGSMAMKIAESETSESKKKALLDMAGQSLSEAYKINSTDSTVLNTYSRYYRAIGQEDKAWEMLEGSQDRELLWRNYYSQGRYQEAKTILEQMFADNPTDSNSVLGLIMVSRVMGDIGGVKENSERLISLKGDVENYLIQIQTFLEVGLVKEAELKLQSFTERFPDENRALLLKAWLMMRQGQLSNALQMVNLYLETNEESPIAWEVRGRIHYLMTDYNQAINDLNRSRTLLNSPTLSIYLSKAYMRAERDQEAIIELQNAMENPQVSETARLLLEQTYKKLNRKDTLNRFYDNTIRELPGSVLWHLKAASFLRQEKEFSRASRLYKRALQLSMESGQDASAALDGYLSSLI
ncbi:MAG: tetratricopeptide repeat protein, partial [Planctomycetota bacterium]